MSEITDAVLRNQFTHVPQESHQYPEISLFSDVFRESREGVARSLAISGFSVSKDRFRSFNIRSRPRYRNILRLEDEIALEYPFNISSYIINLFFTVEWGVTDNAYLA